jgi:hypothetical protein
VRTFASVGVAVLLVSGIAAVVADLLAGSDIDVRVLSLP